MTTVVEAPAALSSRHDARARRTLTAATLGFFIVTLDAVVVNVALPTVRLDLGGGVRGLQWVVDGYTLAFAALLLTAGAFSDRVGARRAFGAGVAMFTLASLACGVAPGLELLVAARVVQGAAAAVMMPASMALIGQAYADPSRRARAVAVWAMGGAAASSSGPVIGGLLTGLDWRLIFLLNVPVGLVTLALLQSVAPSVRRPASIDWPGQLTAVLAMGGLTYGAVQAGTDGIASPGVLGPLALSAAGSVGFVVTQLRGRTPMVPAELRADRTLRSTSLVGFAFMVGYYGLPFVFTLYLQQQRGLSALATGALFLPMMLVGAALTPLSARLVERLGHRLPIVTGLLLMAAGLVTLAALAATAPLWLLSALMVPVGLGGPLVMPPTTGVLLNGVPGPVAGTASGVFNTSRQIGGALAVAVFGALLAEPTGFQHGLRLSLLLAAAVAVLAAAVALQLRTTTR
jgi:EmrB/QacA subfamily drug resistance transporter